MHHPPINPNQYCGITVVTDVGRHDTKQLLDGNAGLFWESNMAPYNRWAMDIRSPDLILPFLPNTKTVLYLGEDSFKAFKPTTDDSITLNELRGTPIIRKGIIHTCSFLPQDAFDRRNYFAEEETEDENENEKVSEKSHQKTKRRNYKFWLHSDLRKTIRWNREGIHSYPSCEVKIYPPIREAIDVLKNRKGEQLYVDIETDKNFNLTCIGFSFKSTTAAAFDYVYVIPFKRYTNNLAYEELEICWFLRALAIAFQHNTVVVWNSIFDLMVLAWKYRVPFPRKNFDGMLAWQRCYPEIEKSLGHAISYLTDLPYHKNEGVFDPHNQYQEQELWNYNGKDIHTLMLCHDKLVRVEIPKLKGLQESVHQANRCIRPYLTMMYKGVKTDTQKLMDRFKELQIKSALCDRILKIITGRPLNPRSSPQVCQYLYDDLGFEEPPEEPTNEKNLLKLQVAHVNKTGNVVPSIRLILFARGLKKAASSIKYRHWSNDGDKTWDRLTCSYNIAGTETFRRGSRRLFKWRDDKNTGFGTNCQNRKKDEKILYIPDEGKKFIKPDQAGAEALIVAYLCRLGNFRNLFLHKVKPHVFVALHLFKDIWERKLSRSMDCYIQSRIPDLKGLEGWSELDSLIKESDNWPSDQRYYYIAKQVCHCVDSETEILTKDGWVKCENYKGGKIATWNKNDWKIKFETPLSWNKFDYNGEMFYFKENAFDQLITPDHTMPYCSNRKMGSKKASEIIKMSGRSVKLPYNGQYEGGNLSLTEFQVRMLVAIQADGSIQSNNRVEFHFKKKRKIERLRWLCCELGLELKEYEGWNNATKFSVKGVDYLVSFFKEKKVWGSWLLDLSGKNMDYFLEEVLEWDGTQSNDTRNAKYYFSSIKENAEWVHTIAHLRMKGGVVRELDGAYNVSFNSRHYSRMNFQSKKQYTGEVYCPTTSTGFFVVRRNGEISITGNSSNYDVKAPTFQMTVLVKSEGSVALSLKQCRESLNTYHSLFPEIRYWHTEIQQELKNGRLLHNLFGFPRRFTGPWGDDLFKKGYAFKPQSTVGIITALTITEVQERIDDGDKLFKDVDILVDEHDGILFQAPIENEMPVAREIHRIMAKELTSPRGEKFRMGVEIKTGFNWSDANDKYNPDGLREIKL